MTGKSKADRQRELGFAITDREWRMERALAALHTAVSEALVDEAIDGEPDLLLLVLQTHAAAGMVLGGEDPYEEEDSEV
jgi:hypothetical protein